eukprot:SAG11_NODE_3_length_39220_cov_67.005828_13_plen_46_part_00
MFASVVLETRTCEATSAMLKADKGELQVGTDKVAGVAMRLKGSSE